MVGSWIIHYLGMFLGQWHTSKSVSCDPIYQRPNIIARARAPAAKLAGDLGSDSSLPKLRKNPKELEILV